MTATIPDSIPNELIAGDTWQWTRDLSDYPAGTWTATVYFENKDGVFNAVGVASGFAHSFTIAAASSTAVEPGRYTWRLRVTDGASYSTIESGTVEVLIDPALAGRVDTRTWARRTLDAVEAFLEGNASTAQQSMQLNGRAITRWSLAELSQWRDKLKQEVKNEDLGDKAGSGRNVKIRFGRA